jgi:hypothetical protein
MYNRAKNCETIESRADSRRRRPIQIATSYVAVFAIAAWLACPAARADHQSLAEALQWHAPLIAEKLVRGNCRTVGVLKFQVRRGNGQPKLDAGNSMFAQQVENALALLNPNGANLQLNLIHDASAVAATIPGADHLSVDGRKRLFSESYPMAWGDKMVDAEAFLTGIIHVADDQKSVRVNLQLIHKQKDEIKLQSFHHFDAKTDGETLFQLNPQPMLRSAASSRRDSRVQAVEIAHRASSDVQARQPQAPRPGVTLRFLYDGRLMTPTFENGDAFLPEPREGQLVQLVLERQGACAKPLCAVVKVNGENVLFRERHRDSECTFYRLDKAVQPITINGYQIDNNRAERFRVGALSESQTLQMYYGLDVGIITLAVFEPLDGDLSTAATLEQGPDLAAIASARFPARPPINAEALQAEMRAQVEKPASRGVITRGGAVGQAIDLLPDQMKLNPDPIMTAVIKYRRSTP